MTKWYKIPAFKALILLIPALAFGMLYDIGFSNLLIICVLSITISVFLIVFKRFFIAYFVLLSCSGLIISHKANMQIIVFPQKSIPVLESVFTGKIIKLHKRTPKYIRFTAEGDINIKSFRKIQNQKVMFTCFINQSDNEYWQILENSIIYSEANLSFQSPKLFPDEFNTQKYLHSLSINWNATTSASKLSVKKSPNPVYKKIYRLREFIDNRIKISFNAYTAGIIKAMLLGDKSEIDYETKQRFSFSGTAHLLAISGLHVGLIASIVHFLLMPFIRNKYLKTILFPTILIIFIFVSGFQDSAVRAGLMAILWSLSYLTPRRIEPLNVASFVIIMMLLFNPSYIYSVSFQMSASAIIGILVFYNFFRNFFIRIFDIKNLIARFISESFSLTFSASIVVAPLVAYYFGVFSIISPAANLIVLPLMSLSLLYSIITISLSLISMLASSIFAGSTEFLVEISDKINELFIDMPYAYTNSSELALIFSLLLSIFVVYLFSSLRRNQAVLRFIIISIFTFSSIIILQKVDFDRPQDISIYPREQFVLLEVNSELKNVIIVIDRKPYQRPKNDFAVINYLKNKPDSYAYYFTGNAGINIADKIKKLKKIEPQNLTIEQQIRLKNIINSDKEFSQIID